MILICYAITPVFAKLSEDLRRQKRIATVTCVLPIVLVIVPAAVHC